MELQQITYATKVWGGEFKDVLERHPEANLIIANNLGKRVVDIGDTDNPYFEPELEAVHQAETKYILWYAGDVIPPDKSWLEAALPLLDQYPIVTCRGFGDNIDPMQQEHVKFTNFGWLTQHFSDQCYLSTAEFMRQIDYYTDHPIAKAYPKHGGNSFERRVAQYLANNDLWVACLKDYRYRHLDRREK